MGFFLKVGYLDERAKKNVGFEPFGSVLTIFISFSGSVIVYSGLVIDTMDSYLLHNRDKNSNFFAWNDKSLSID